jgi:hypothetical protein
MPAGIDEFSGNIEDVDTPLLFEPGTKFNYGVSIHSFHFCTRYQPDIVTDEHRLGGHTCRARNRHVFERLVRIFPEDKASLPSTGCNINSIISQLPSQHLRPPRHKNISFFPTPEMVSNLAHMHARSPAGKITPREHLLRMYILRLSLP